MDTTHMTTLDYTLQQLVRLKKLNCWGEDCSASPLTLFLQEWFYHLSDDKAILLQKQIMTQWRQDLDHQWKSTLMTGASNTLFSLADSEQWMCFIAALNKGNHYAVSNICQEITEWVSSHVQKENIHFSRKLGEHYNRKVLSVIPYQQGVAITVVFRFPVWFVSHPHKHPECVAEKIISGKMIELNLAEVPPTKTSGKKTYEITQINEYEENALVFKNCGTGFPHIVATQEQECLCVATFAGKMPAEAIDMADINNRYLYGEYLSL